MPSGYDRNRRSRRGEGPKRPERLPRVDVIALGGTIASVKTGDQSGVAPGLSTAEILAAIPSIHSSCRVVTRQFLQVPSSHILISDLLRLRDLLCRSLSDGAGGVVVTQGTDTLEESAYVLDLIWERQAPVVFTGAMRNPASAGPDGPANVLAAIQVPLSRHARKLGSLVVMNDEIHSARLVQKKHTFGTGAFKSLAGGPLGWICEGQARIIPQPTRGLTVPVETGAETAGSTASAWDG